MKKLGQGFKVLCACLLILSCNDKPGTAQQRRFGENTTGSEGVMDSEKKLWVDSVYHSLSEEQRIGQLFMIAAYSGGDNYNEELITSLIREHDIGGLIFMQGTPEAQARLTNKYQSLSRVPLLIGMDAEWGLGMRLTGVKNFPRQMMLGAARNEKLVYELGKHIAEQCRVMGVHINFAPDIDINNNSDNPVINFRSFGEERDWVAKLGIAYMRGLQNHNVLACAKHFPGHGDVDIDSHLDLPVIAKTKPQLDSIELYPFRQLSEAGVASIMIAHLEVPTLDSSVNTPTTLSYKVVTEILKNELNYKGLIITDALNMSGVTKHYSAGEADLKAFMAGNDILLFSQDVPLAVNKIKAALKEGHISAERLEHSVKKILSSKYDAGLTHIQPLSETGLTARLNDRISPFWEKAAMMSVTMVRDHNNILQKLRDPGASVAYIAINGEGAAFIQKLKESFPGIEIVKSLQNTDRFDVLIAGIHQVGMYPGAAKNYNITNSSLGILKGIQHKDNSLVILHGNAYTMKYLCGHRSVIVAYEEHESTFEAILKILSGQLTPAGTLPVTICH